MCRMGRGCRLPSLCSGVDLAFVNLENHTWCDVMWCEAPVSTNDTSSDLEVLAEFVESKAIIEFTLCLITKSPT